jgi:hypothetical protein
MLSHAFRPEVIWAFFHPITKVYNNWRPVGGEFGHLEYVGHVDGYKRFEKNNLVRNENYAQWPKHREQDNSKTIFGPAGDPHGEGKPMGKAGAYVGLRKYDNKVCDITEDFNEVITFVLENYASRCGVYKMSAVEIEEFLYLADVELCSSSGYPMNLQYKWKVDVISAVGLPRLILWLDSINVHDLIAIHVSCQKVELRSTEKDPRQFTAAPFVHWLVGIRYFGRFHKDFLEIGLPSIVGTSPQHHGWQRMLLKYVKRVVDLDLPDAHFCGDVSKFDSRMSQHFMKREAEYMFSRSGNSEQVRWFYNNVIWALYLMPDGAVFMKEQGNPSGRCNTTDWNTFYNMVIQFYMLRKQGKSWYECVMWPLLIYSDDFLSAWPFKQPYTEAWKEHIESMLRHEVTNESLDGGGLPNGSSRLAACQILSAAWRKYHGVYIPVPINTNKIIASLTYVEAGVNPCDVATGLMTLLAGREDLMQHFCEYLVEVEKVDPSLVALHRLRCIALMTCEETPIAGTGGCVLKDIADNFKTDITLSEDD